MPTNLILTMTHTGKAADMKKDQTTGKNVQKTNKFNKRRYEKPISIYPLLFL